MFIDYHDVDLKDILFLLFPSFMFPLDSDECESDTDGCSDRCINTIGSYRCECYEGRSLNDDRRMCSGRNVQGKLLCSNM